jgi:monofunctional biosynthetic peptidoglycan transglycosylase
VKRAAIWVPVAAALGFVAHHSADVDFADDLARGLSQLSGHEVTVAHARLALPATFRIEDVEAGPFRLGSAAISLDLRAALAGKRRVGRVELSDLAAGPLKAATVDLRLDGGDGRLVARKLAFRRAGVGMTIAELGAEIAHRAPRRFAFGGAEVAGTVGGLAGVATRDSDGSWKLRAAREGLTATGRWQAGTLLVRAELDKLSLAPLTAAASALGLEVSRGAATGTLWLRSEPEELRARGQLALANVAVAHPSIAPQPVGPLTLQLDGELRRVPGMLTVEELEVRAGPAALNVSAQVAESGRFDAQLFLAQTSCPELLAALPRSLIPALDGMELDGTLAGRAHLYGDRASLDKLKLGVDLDVACKVRVDPPLADAHALAKAVERPRATDEHGRDRTFVLGPANPSWRPLESLPPVLERAVLTAEDDRFFLHKGFDLDTIRRAVSADLTAHRFERGASTISQQVVKNLFLSGERTAARKLEEAVLTWRLEQILSKRRILELYLNLVELGPGLYGVAEASERYFGKEPDQLSLDEAAQLAALLPAPRRGMDAAWQERYEKLKARIPNEIILGMR